MILIVLITVTFVSTVLCQPAVYRCNRDWTDQARCLADNGERAARNDRDFPVPDKRTQSDIKRNVVSCFRKQRCQSNPVPTDQEMDARRDCFKNAKRQLDQELERCVDDKIRGWSAVEEYPRQDIEEWTHVVNSINDALRNPRSYCDDSRRTRADLQQCIDRETSYNFNHQTSTRLPDYWCNVDARCWSETSDQCQRQWDDDVQPAMCQCSRKPSFDRALRNAQDDYRQCVDRRFRRNEPQSTLPDPALDWLSDYVKDMCQNKNNHPCKNERRDYDRNRRG